MHVTLEEVLPNDKTPGTRTIVIKIDTVQLVEPFPAEYAYSTRGAMSIVYLSTGGSRIVSGTPAEVYAQLQGE